MTAPRRLFTLALAAAALTALGAGPSPQGGSPQETPQVRISQVDTSRFPEVTVYVSVTDASGEPVGVDPQRIVLEENGEAIVLDEVRGLGESETLSTMLVIDVSGSMNVSGKLRAAQAAARAYVRQMRDGDQAGVIAFNTRIFPVQPITTDRTALGEAIDSLQASDDTALYDAVAEAVRALDSVGGRRAILVLSDGMDNSSLATPEEALALIGPTGLSISTIGLGDPSRAPGEWAGLDVAVLSHLAERAGGNYSAVGDAQALRSLYERLGRALQSEFVLRYTSPSGLRDGLDRSLTVSLTAAAAAPAAQAAYNPGGLVPEVPRPAPWPVFLGALAVLAAMVVIPASAPGLARRFRRERPVKAREAGRRIRLQEPREPRVRLR